MPDTKVTPGPWMHGEPYSTHSIPRNWEVSIISIPENVCLALANGATPQEADANARLLTAAPDLLSTLKALIKAVQCGDSEPVTEIVEAVSAIAKAEGRDA